MSSLKSFVISDEEDKENFDGVSNLALTLDYRDFSIDSYPVDSKKYPLIGKALLRGKGKAVQVEEEEEEDVEDIGGVGGTPSSSTVNLESDNSLDDVVPLGHASVSHSVSGDFSRLTGILMTLHSHWDQWGFVRKLRNPLTIAFRLFFYAPYTPLRFWVMLCTFV